MIDICKRPVGGHSGIKDQDTAGNTGPPAGSGHPGSGGRRQSAGRPPPRCHIPSRGRTACSGDRRPGESPPHPPGDSPKTGRSRGGTPRPAVGGGDGPAWPRCPGLPDNPPCPASPALWLEPASSPAGGAGRSAAGSAPGGPPAHTGGCPDWTAVRHSGRAGRPPPGPPPSR